MSRLADAWERVEAAVKATPYAYVVRIAPALAPVLPYRTGVDIRYLPEGKTRRRTDEIRGEGLTLAEALDALADALEARR